MLFSSFSWMRRLAPGFAILSAALLIMVPLAACGGGSSSSTSTGPVNLTFWGWIPYADSVALFNRTHPGIHVTWSNVGAGVSEYDKLNTAIKANNEPDVAEIEYPLIPSFEATGSLLDLSPYGVGSIKGQFVPWSWNQVTIGSAIYAVPEDSGPMGMFYRADLFKKYNLPVPTTWAQYADVAAKLHAANPNAYITNFQPRDSQWFTGLVWQAGGQPFGINGQSWKVSINNPAALQVASYWQDLINKKLIKTEPGGTNTYHHDIQIGAIATWIEAGWGSGSLRVNAPQTAGDWRVAPMPQWQAGQMAAGNVGGGADVVFKTTQHPKEAAEFVSWLGTNTQNLDMLIKGAGAVYPAAQAGLALPSLNGPQPFFGNQVTNEVFHSAATNINYNFQWGPTMNQTFNDMQDDFANAINGHGTLSDALNAVQQSTVTFMKKQGFGVST